MAEYKSIVIKVKDKSIPPGLANEWSDVTTHMPILTRDIKTPALDAKSDLTAVVSGMPTIFARANLFRLAIDYVGAITPKTDESEGLLNYYKNLVDEWRGFIACIALDYTLIEVSDGKIITWYDLSKKCNIPIMCQPHLFGCFHPSHRSYSPLYSLFE